MEKLKLYGKKDKEKREFLGTIYINKKGGIVIDVQDPQVKKDIVQEISKEIQEHGGVGWAKRIETKRDFEKYKEELEQCFKKSLGKKFGEYIKEAKKIEMSLKKENVKEESIKEMQEKLEKKLEKYGLILADLMLFIWPEPVKISILTRSLFYEKPGEPFFLNAVRQHLYGSLKKYGGYTLTKPLPIVEEK